MILNSASYRDPLGQVYEKNDKIYRKVLNNHKSFIEKFISSNFYIENQKQNIIKTKFVDPKDFIQKNSDSKVFWLEHEKINFITYPHEWGFETLKQVAIFHLNLQKQALKNGYTIKDSSPYNVQFKNGNPVFIDFLSFDEYKEGSYWVAYKQFCKNFLNPLLIKSYTGIDHNQFFRGAIDGIGSELTSNILPKSSWLSFNCLSHVHLPAWAEKKINSTSKNLLRKPKSGISSHNLIALWDSLISFIQKLKVKKKSYWGDYENNTSYNNESTDLKDTLVGKYIHENNLKTVLDLGCNTGRYSRIAFKNSANHVIGLDIDGTAIDKANLDKDLKTKEFIGLQFDLMNPSPKIGWRNQERLTLWERLPNIDGIICLALIHHICIGKNVPLSEFINFLCSIANNILIEFVPKSDPMVKGLLAHREDIFKEYNEEHFQAKLQDNKMNFSIHEIKGSTRKLYECKIK